MSPLQAGVPDPCWPPGWPAPERWLGHESPVSSPQARVELSGSPRGAASSSSSLGLALPQFPQS